MSLDHISQLQDQRKYHHENEGLVERCGVFERMLKPFVTDHKHNWDKFISFLMFAYREVVNDNMKFIPAEIIYGQNFRGPLHVMREG